MPIAMDRFVWFGGGQSLRLRYTDDVLLSAVGVPQAADEIQLLLPQNMLLHTHIYTYPLAPRGLSVVVERLAPRRKTWVRIRRVRSCPPGFLFLARMPLALWLLRRRSSSL